MAKFGIPPLQQTARTQYPVANDMGRSGIGQLSRTQRLALRAIYSRSVGLATLLAALGAVGLAVGALSYFQPGLVHLSKVGRLSLVAASVTALGGYVVFAKGKIAGALLADRIAETKSQLLDRRVSTVIVEVSDLEPADWDFKPTEFRKSDFQP